MAGRGARDPGWLVCGHGPFFTYKVFWSVETVIVCVVLLLERAGMYHNKGRARYSFKYELKRL